MNKISQYLNEHILGEITASKAVRQKFSRDGSVLSIMPDLVMFPRVTSDIRKAARFSWQLAEKGHTLPLTARGGGSDQTGASIGGGLIINTTAHLNNVIQVALKDKERLVHVQPGVTFKSLNDILSWHGLFIPSSPESGDYATVGGAVANNSGGHLSGKYGLTGEWVSRLEIVLANGDLLETGRISKRDLSKKIGLQTFEGEIYRKLDALIEENEELIENKIAKLGRDNAGYAGIAKVKDKGDSFDLTPLFVGSQGTLGIISEIVLRADFISPTRSVIVVAFDEKIAGRDVADKLRLLEPAALETMDGELFKKAATSGKKYPFSSENIESGIVLYVMFNDFGARARAHKLKKVAKVLKEYSTAQVFTSESYPYEELDAVREVMGPLFLGEAEGESMPPLIDGAHIPSDRYEEFCGQVSDLAARHHVELPIMRRVLDSMVFIRPTLRFGKVGDKQMIMKLINDYSQLVAGLGGVFVSQSAEGRMKSTAAYANLDEDIIKLYAQIREIFDPYGSLNPDVKQPIGPKVILDALRTTYDVTDFAEYAPHS